MVSHAPSLPVDGMGTRAKATERHTMSAPISLTDRERRIAGVIAVVVLALLSTFPLFTASIPYGHDLLFHLARVQSIADGLRAGVIPVRLFSAQASGFGYPTGICYPDVLLYLPALLVLIGCDLWIAYVLFVLAVNLATATLALHTFRQVFRSWRIGLMCCALWTLSPYRLCDVLLRASVGEYLALMFAPLLVLGLWRLFLDDESKPGAGWLTLAIGASGVVLSHILSVAMLMPPCVLAIIPLALWRRKNGWLLGLAKAAGVSVLLCVGFLVPFFSYYLAHDLGVKYFSNSCAMHALEPAQIFEAFQEMSGESVQLGWDLSGEMPMGTGWCLLLALPLSALPLALPSVRTDAYGRMRRWLVLFCAASIAYLFLSTCWFPWNLDVPVLKTLVDAMAVIQFPWRLVGVASMLLTLLLGVVASCTKPQVQIACAASLALAVAECGVATNSYLRTAERKPLWEYLQRDPAIGMGEYLPIELSVNDAKGWRVGYVPQGGGTLESCETITPQAWRVTVRNDASETQRVRLPLLWHHQLELKAEEGAGEATLCYDGGYAAIELEPHARGTYSVTFVEPLTWRAAEVVSLATAVGLTVFVVRRKRQSAKTTSAETIG